VTPKATDPRTEIPSFQQGKVVGLGAVTPQTFGGFGVAQTLLGKLGFASQDHSGESGSNWRQ